MYRIIILLLCMAVAACADNKSPTQAAPIGDKATLERLAKEYNKLAEGVPVTLDAVFTVSQSRTKVSHHIYVRAGSARSGHDGI